MDPEFARSELVSYCAFGQRKPRSEEMRNSYTMELCGLETGSGLLIESVCCFVGGNFQR